MYDKEQTIVEILDVIKKEELTFFEDICLHVVPARKTLYEWQLHESDIIKDALRKNKLAIKAKMRKRWQEHDSPVLQVAAYKLIAEDEELQKLTMNKFEHSGNGGNPIQTETKHVVEFLNYADSSPKVQP